MLRREFLKLALSTPAIYMAAKYGLPNDPETKLDIRPELLMTAIGLYMASKHADQLEAWLDERVARTAKARKTDQQRLIKLQQYVWKTVNSS